MDLWEDLGVEGSTAIIVLVVLYHIIKWAVKNGIKEAYSDIVGEKTANAIETDKLFKETESEDDE